MLWFADGKAAGLDGVYYDNRDRKHSDLGIENYPQLKPIRYTKEELARRADWGGQGQILPGKVVVGNSSTASPANQAGSHQRIFYAHPRGLDFLYQQYRSNALYIYPEHRDHDPGTNGLNGYGDLYPANSPYLISSQGSSGSDRVFVHAFLKTIAAFPPETREVLVSKRLLMPTLQAIFRQTYKASVSPNDYFTGTAHPSAFEGNLIDELTMVSFAQVMRPAEIPPLVILRVIQEPNLESGRDYFEPSSFTAGECLSDSPCAIARVIRGPDFRRQMRVSAAETFDPNGLDLNFRWVVLRGDPELIEIETFGENGEEANISVSYHPRRPIAPGSDMSSNRVDIGVFAKAEGKLVSAPAFVSFSTLPNEHRNYSTSGRLLEIFYGARSQSLGLPSADSERWDALLAGLNAATQTQPPGIKIFTNFLTEDEQAKLTALAAATTRDRARVAALTKMRSQITAAQQQVLDATNQERVEAEASHKKLGTADSKAALDAANAQHQIAKKIKRDGAAKLEPEIAKWRNRIAAAIGRVSAPQIVRSGLERIHSDDEFYSANEAAIRAAAEDSPNPNALNALGNALERLKWVGVAISDTPPDHERYHLEQFNADILGDVLLPQFLNRPPGLNYVDPRLTSPKHWRDVYRYGDDGKLTGWTRYQNGQRTEFDQNGDLILSRKPDGSPNKVVHVRYSIDPKTKRLQATETK